MLQSILFILLLIAPIGAAAQYRPDILGEGFEQRTLDMGEDYSGRVVATVVRLTDQSSSQRAVLYIHGFNDYFFQRDMAHRFTDSLYRFYALDLRKYGRSKLAHQSPFELLDISEYYADINSAIELIHSEGAQEITLMGHSTGGLVCALYASRHRDRVDRLILNSPFLDMNDSALNESVLIPLISMVAPILPNIPIPMGSSTAYGESLHIEDHGEWEFDKSLKLSPSPTMRSSWLRAIHLAHCEVQQLRDLEIPILLLYSDRSASLEQWSEQAMSADIVLDVEDIAHYGDQLGESVTHAKIAGGVHDILLSPYSSREAAYSAIFRWLDLHPQQ